MAFRPLGLLKSKIRRANIAIARHHLQCMFFLDKLDLPVFIVLEEGQLRGPYQNQCDLTAE